MKPALIYRGLLGLGDNLHQRGIIRQLMRGNTVYLETTWVSLYHDLIAEGLIVKPRHTELRTQAKNARREAALFSERPFPSPAAVYVQGYTPAACVRSTVLEAMCEHAGVSYDDCDFRLPVPDAWQAKADKWIRKWRPDRPILIYRPLVERQEWGGCAARNPDGLAYTKLLREIGRDFFIVSVADTDPLYERISSPPIEADVECHLGELDIETLAALTQRAALAYCSSGFMAILAQAVATPTLMVFGGYESAARYLGTARYAPYLGIDPINPCNCYAHDHACAKEINMAAAVPEVRRFAAAARRGFNPTQRPEISVTPPPFDLDGMPTRYMNPGELEVIVDLIASVRPRHVVEIGVNTGRTAATILRAVPGIERYTGIDVTPDYVTPLPVQRGEVLSNPGSLAAGDPRFNLVVSRQGTHDMTVLPACDAVFIDGDHSRRGVLHDTALAREAVRPGGLIIWHDDNGQSVVQVTATLDEMHAYREAEPVHVKDTWVAFERVPA